MSNPRDLLDDLLPRSATVRDEDLIPLANTPSANALFAEIVSMPHGGEETHSRIEMEPTVENLGSAGNRARDTVSPHRLRNVLVAVTLALAVGVSVPAFGVVPHIKSWFSDLKGSDNPIAQTPDVVLASGVDGRAWRIVATQTNEGLCVFLFTQRFGEPLGLGGCGWASDIRGYGSADELHWIAGTNGSGGIAVLNRNITYGVTAEGVASVDLELANGQAVTASLIERPDGLGGPLNFYWAALGTKEGVKLNADGGAMESELPLVHALVARDSAGNILERRIVDGSHG